MGVQLVVHPEVAVSHGSEVGLIEWFESYERKRPQFGEGGPDVNDMSK